VDIAVVDARCVSTRRTIPFATALDFPPSCRFSLGSLLPPRRNIHLSISTQLLDCLSVWQSVIFAHLSLPCISNRISTLVEKRVVGGRHAAAPAQSDAPGVAARGRVRDGDSRVCATRGRPLLSPAAGSEPASDTRVPGLDAAGCRARFERPRPRTCRDAPRVPRWTSRTVGRDAASVTRRAAARPRSADRAPRWARLGRDGSRW
jgi:hypothetical protein